MQSPEPDARSTLDLPPGPWTTVLDCLAARFPRIDRETWRARMRRGRVLDAEGRALAEDAAHSAGLRVHYFREVEHEPPIPFEAEVLHVDRHLVVVDKPHFLPVVPAGRFVRETLLARLTRRLGNADLVPLHRIDRETAGLVLFSASRDSRAAYQALFRERRIRKQYEALAPALPGLAFPCERRSRLMPGEPFFRMCEEPGTANAHTRIDVLAREDDVWRYALEPVSGRKHQLRVHMAALGAPIAGDRLYPELGVHADDDFDAPLALLARRLAFVDPLDGRPRSFESRRRLTSR
ncbi:pseudouridine synthase [Coralloluteibacterium stylophorae]|uniref:Pseudouridine synthase n=2 Tax=Coralloluteibacterium stylophorae TaxID=1776034 RepID=A0A8J7VWC4_9GAMM|nr:pseudouridine synthase [Coralloluteibacterium stylophorae]MBS7455608.1 pseudouridine synthase [Coralloluteibacterium stylophorae]